MNAKEQHQRQSAMGQRRKGQGIQAVKTLSSRGALVTGASRGIGAGIAIALAKAGADIAVNYRQKTDAAKAVCSDIAGREEKHSRFRLMFHSQPT